VEAIVPVFSALASFADKNRTAFLALAGVLATLSAGLIAVAAVTKIYTTYQKLMAIDTVKAVLALKDADGQLTKVGKTVQGVGKAFAAVGLAQVFFSIGNSAMGMSQKIKIASEEMIIAVGGMSSNSKQSTKEVAEAFIKTARTIQDQLRLEDPIREFGRDFQFVVDGIKVNIESADEAFEKFLDQDPNLAQKIIDGLKAQLAVTDPTSRAYQDLSDAIARYESRLNKARAAQEAFNGAVQATPTIAFTGAMARLEATTQREFKARLSSAGAIEEWNKKVEESRNRASGAAKELKTAEERLSDYTSALKGNYDAQRSLSSATRSREAAEKSMTQATDNARKAQEYFNKVVKGFPRDSKEATTATRQYEEAQRRVRDATMSQRDAVLSVKEAEQELQKLRDITSDPEDVADAERNLERSKYAVEEANFAVTEAEAELAALRLDPEASAVQIRRAEIALAEAKLGVSESVQRVKDAELALNNEINRKATADEIAEAERNLEEAKEAVTRQTEDLRDATIEEAVAQDVMNRILNGAAESTDEYQEALRELNDAKTEEEEARIRVAESILAEAEATLSLANAIKELNKVSAVTPKNVIRRGQAEMASVATSNPALAALNQVATPQQTAPEINVTVNAGIGSDPDSITRGLMDMFKQYERANGFLPLNVQSAVAFG
jgi:chromosome segregation ATPase